MKVTVTFKTPDAVDEAINEGGIVDEDEIEKVRDVINKFVEYGEYVHIEFDINLNTGAGTATVLPVKE